MTVTSRAALLLVAGALALGPRSVEACCPAGPREAPIRIADQEILIVWDPVTRTEHFIREARFANGVARDRRAPPTPDAAARGSFGFLVPSPTRPEVVESDGSVFAALRERIKPRIVTIDRWIPTPTALVLLPFISMRGAAERSDGAIMAAAAERKAVEVLETKRVAGFDVAVLAASNAGALTEWLGTNGYDARPALTEWSEPYVKKGWIITAFKYAADAGRVETGAVRMSFKTDTPLFPYRVPTDNVAPEGRGNILRAFVVGPGRATGTLGEGSTAHPWSQAELKHARPVAPADLGALIGKALPAGAAEGMSGAWLTAFEDPTWPSGVEDLTFAHDPAGAEHEEVIEHVVEHHAYIPLDVIGLLVVGGIVVVRRRKAAA